MTGFIVGAGVTLLGTLLNLILKKFVTPEIIDNWGKAVKKTFNALGITITLGLSKMPYIKDVWNSIIEPYVIIILDVIAMNAVSGLVQGLETDKPSLLVDESKKL
jgi:hypothetical protein